jgi:serine/threonine protein kinase
MIKSANIGRTRTTKEWFKSGTAPEAIELITKMLEFSPEKRPNIDEILKHPYLSQFRDVKTEIESKKSITPPISDSKKLNLKQYRNLIY